MLESRSEPSASPSHSELVFRAPLFRVQRGLRIDFASCSPSRPPHRNCHKASLALAMGYRYLQAVEQGEAQDFAALARKLKVSRAWVSMCVELTFLAPKIQEDILLATVKSTPIQELVRMARLWNWVDQINHWNSVHRRHDFPPER